MKTKRVKNIAICFILAVSISSIADCTATIQAQEKPELKRDRAWIERRIAEWQPTKAERAFDQIGWASDLLEAERLAKKHRRPIFLFTYDGESLACYRC